MSWTKAQFATYWRGKRLFEKARLLEAYGGKCACCDALMALTIDHIYNDGAAIRRERKGEKGHGLYKWLKNRGFPHDRYQLLCRSCNFAKHQNGGNCPHESMRILCGGVGV